MKSIYLLIGIPGSGKSYWLKGKENSDSMVLDDISQIKNPLDLLSQGISNSSIKKIYIADVNFLELSVLKKAQEMIKNKMGNQPYEIKYVLFKSTKQISEKNVELRNDGRNVEGTILRFHKNYDTVINYLEDNIYTGRIEIIETKIYKINNKKPR